MVPCTHAHMHYPESCIYSYSNSLLTTSSLRTVTSNHITHKLYQPQILVTKLRYMFLWCNSATTHSLLYRLGLNGTPCRYCSLSRPVWYDQSHACLDTITVKRK